MCRFTACTMSIMDPSYPRQCTVGQVIPEALLCWLRTQDPSKPLYKGYGSQQHIGPNNISVLEENWFGHISFIVGGGGTVVSKAFAELFVPHALACRKERRINRFLEDIRFGMCAYSIIWKHYNGNASAVRDVVAGNRHELGFSKTELPGWCVKVMNRAGQPHRPVITTHLKFDEDVFKFWEVVLSRICAASHYSAGLCLLLCLIVVG